MRRLAAVLVGGTLALAAPAAAAPPEAGVLVPGASLGGVDLGWTRAQVLAAWGRAHARCSGCRRETLYFNRVAFQPQGAAVELERGTVSAVFTLWAPPAWRTAQGLRIGEPLLRLQATYPGSLHVRCAGYDAYALPGRQARSVVYTVDHRVWGFALLRPGHPVCL